MPIWFLIGPGGSGKTLEARWLNWRLEQHGRSAILAALDPSNRSLATWFDGVRQPPSRDGGQISRWLSSSLDTLIGLKTQPTDPLSTPALFDFGGGDVALAQTVEKADLVGALDQAAFGLVACYALTPRIDDLGVLLSLEQGLAERKPFQPAATVLLLNEGRADPSMPRAEAFASITRHSAFRKAVARGAQVVWMPALDADVMLEIDAKRLSFTEARDGLVPEGASARRDCRPALAPVNAPLCPRLTFEEKARAAQEAMRRAVAKAGLQNDPYGAVIETASDGIGLIVEADARIEATLERLQQPIDTEAITKAAREAFFRENTWQRQMAAEAARDAARKELRRHVSITAAAVALAVAFTVLCMTLRHDRQMAELEDAQSAVTREAFADGPASANTWIALMAYNHVRDLLGPGCRQVVIEGRRGCDTRVWLDAPTKN